MLIHSVLADLRGSELPDFAAIAETRGFIEAATGYVAELTEGGVELRQLLKGFPEGDSDTAGRHQQATRIFDHYQRRLAKQQRLDPPDRLGRAAKLWAEEHRRPFECVRSVFVGGFTSFTPHQIQLIKAIRESVEHLWIELPDGEGEEFAITREVRAWLKDSGESTRFRREVVPETVVPAPSHLIEAPGELGEARLVARRIRALLVDDVQPGRVLVVARHFTPAAIESLPGTVRRIRNTARCRGREHAWPCTGSRVPLAPGGCPMRAGSFAAVAAVLRSTYFRPNWPELQADPEMPAKAEALLRMLGEARGKDAFLAAVRIWEDTPPEPLEDEKPEEPLRQRKQRLAARCRPFLERFFHGWDKHKSAGTPEATVARFKEFASDFGLSLAPSQDADDMRRLWCELDGWASHERSTAARKRVSPDRFERVLNAVTSVPCRARTARGRGVALLSAENAVGLECDYLFLVGLGEGSWPDLSAPVSLLDDAERERLRAAGFALADPSQRLAEERLLFQTLVMAPKCELVLSYAAVDGKGQKLLPSSFLRELVAKASPSGATHRRMLLDGFFDQQALSVAELRVQYAHSLAGVSDLSPPSGGSATSGSRDSLAPELIDNLSRAQAVARARFHSNAFTRFDGELRHPSVCSELAKRLGPERVFSPTALEHYIACPFRFMLQNVLRLEPLEDPSEEVESTRRGSAFHRALARFHRALPETFADADLPARVTDGLVDQLKFAVGEYADRAPSRATAELWRLEGQRLERAAKRYRDHWHRFRKPWREQNATPIPRQFEASFGVPVEGAAAPLVITVGDVEVRVGGYIDRVDLVQLEETAAFWVIDYKTGRAGNYSATQVKNLEKLQLPLYALAVERVLFAGQIARPLGLAYWLVTDTGPKPMLPSGKKACAILACGCRDLAEVSRAAGGMGRDARRAHPRRRFSARTTE